VLGVNSHRAGAGGENRITAAELAGADIDGALTRPAAAPVHVSFDVAALDSAYAPGSLHHPAGGLNPASALAIAAALGRRQVAGVALTGLAPGRDQGGRTTWLALQILLELLAEHVADREGEGR
jgi:arginase family enzyme